MILGVCIGYIIGRYDTFRLITNRMHDDVPFRFGGKYYFIVLDKVYYQLRRK